MAADNVTTLEVLGPLNLAQSDQELGEWLLGAWLGWQAERRGIPLDAIPEDWACGIVEATAGMDSDNFENVALESAFRKSCRGDFEGAGGMLRAYANDRGLRTAHGKLASEAVRQRVAKRVGSKRGGEASRAKAAWHADCVRAAQEILASGKHSRELAGILARRFGVTPTQIRNVLRKAKVA